MSQRTEVEPVIPAKAGIQNLWIPQVPATVGLDARLLGHGPLELVLDVNEKMTPSHPDAMPIQ